MQFKLKHTLFPTESLYAMRQFISEVLDKEVHQDDGKYYFELAGMTFQLVEVRPLNLVKEVSHFEFEVEDHKTFLGLKDKVDFFYFRQNKKLLNSQDILKSEFDGPSLKIYDPDGRLWNFVLKDFKDTQIRPKTHDSILN